MIIKIKDLFSNAESKDMQGFILNPADKLKRYIKSFTWGMIVFRRYATSIKRIEIHSHCYTGQCNYMLVLDYGDRFYYPFSSSLVIAHAVLSRVSKYFPYRHTHDNVTLFPETFRVSSELEVSNFLTMEPDKILCLDIDHEKEIIVYSKRGVS